MGKCGGIYIKEAIPSIRDILTYSSKGGILKVEAKAMRNSGFAKRTHLHAFAKCVCFLKYYQVLF
jgi:hypothetical protein